MRSLVRHAQSASAACMSTWLPLVIDLSERAAIMPNDQRVDLAAFVVAGAGFRSPNTATARLRAVWERRRTGITRLYDRGPRSSRNGSSASGSRFCSRRATIRRCAWSPRFVVISAYARCSTCLARSRTRLVRPPDQIIGVAREAQPVELVGEALRALGAQAGAVFQILPRTASTRWPATHRRSSTAFDEEGASLRRVEPVGVRHRQPTPTPLGGSVEASRRRLRWRYLAVQPVAAADIVALNAAVVFYVDRRRRRSCQRAFERARSGLGERRTRGAHSSARKDVARRG